MSWALSVTSHVTFKSDFKTKRHVSFSISTTQVNSCKLFYSNVVHLDQ